MNKDRIIGFGLIFMVTVGLIAASGLVNLAAAKLALYQCTGVVVPW